MGCASSTPMIATAGSEMLKSASHVAADAAKSAEHAVEDVTHTLGKSLEAAKDSVGHTVTDMANDLGTALKEKTDMLDDAKNSLMGKLHLGEAEASIEKKMATTAQTEVAKEHASNDTTHDIDANDDADIKRTDEMPTRAPTPLHDVDSLKTSTPEPEIEQALANFMADSPPTPKPTFAELEKLTTEAVDKTSAALLKELETLPQQVEKSTQNVVDKAVEKVAAAVTEAKPSEQNAPPVDKNKTESELPDTTEWEKYADMLSQHRKFNPGDAFKRGGKFKSSSDLKLPSVPNVPRASELQQNTDPMRAIEVTRAPPTPSPSSKNRARANTNLALRQQKQNQSDSDTNTNNNNSPSHSNPSSVHSSQLDLQPKRVLSATNTKKIQSELASLMFLADISGIGRNGEVETKAASRAQSRAQSRAPSRAASRGPSRATSRAASRAASPAKSPNKTGSVSRSTTRSSNKSSPQLSRTSTLASLNGGGRNVIGTRSKIQTKIKAKQRGPLPKLPRPANSTRENKTPTLLRARSPAHLTIETPAIVGLSRSPSRVLNTSSFLNSPRSSPFTIRKNYTELKEHENKGTFVPDLSSTHMGGNHLTASPYKIRERCAVCYNKYVIK